jgi:hypothetical protein
MNLAEIINEKLEGIYDTGDVTYRAIVSDVDGISGAIIQNPADINRGALHDLIEYYRIASSSWISQMDYNNASGRYLEHFNNQLFKLPRLVGETEAQQKERVKYYVIGPKIGRAAIINAMRQFSSSEPRIEDGGLDIAFADVSYADNYTSFQLDMPGDNSDGHYVYPAITSQGADSGVFFFTIFLTDTSENDIPRLLSYLQTAVASGTEYEVVIE